MRAGEKTENVRVLAEHRARELSKTANSERQIDEEQKKE